MRFRIIVIYILIAICIVGCSGNIYKESIKKGNEYLADKNYTEAEKSYRLALTEKNDKAIFKTTEQIGNIIDIKDDIKNNEYNKALDKCNKIDKEGYANDLIKQDIYSLKKDIELEIKNKKIREEKNNTETNNNIDESISNNKKENIDSNKVSEEDNIKYAKLTILQISSLSEDEVKITYVDPSELGTAMSENIKNNYYIFKIYNLSDGTTWDTYYSVNKNSNGIYEMDMYGNIISEIK
ncbi:hypothetical protein [Paraclostridium bifermentans]|uniref:hypothetical protein n=1 Tax=Paraclostridium bifermentans TaxID=1490 RepID=UPI000412AC52|nr:hypothetical protein [Paraclostridium bifermentans]